MASPSDPTELYNQDPEAEQETSSKNENNKTLNPEPEDEEDDMESTKQATVSSSYHLRGGGPKKKKVTSKLKRRQEKAREKHKVLMKNLKPVPFIPNKTLDFDKHEKLLKILGLWDFVHLDFDQNLRQDLLAELMAFYRSENRCSYVRSSRINISRADLARALKLPKKKDIVVTEEEKVVLEDDESVKFVEEMVSSWVLLQKADMWIMPTEVVEWTRDIRKKELKKLDWADLFWFMVEKELKSEPPLGECFFASHLQLLIKTQKEEVLKKAPRVVEYVEEEEDDVKEVHFLVKSPKEDCLEVKEEDAGAGTVAADLSKEDVDAGPSGAADLSKEDVGASVAKEDKYVDEDMIELNLGQETVAEMAPEEEEGPVEREPTDVEREPTDVEREPMDVEGEQMDVEESKKEDGEKWTWNEDTPSGSHFLRRCDLGNTRDGDEEDQMEGSMEIGEEEERIEDVGEEETEEDKEKHEGGFPFFPNGDSLQGVGQENLMLGDSSPLGYATGLQIHGNSTGGDFLGSRVDMHMGMGSGSTSLFGNGNNNKREIDHENDFAYHPHNPGNKRLRTEEPAWDDKPPPSVELCLDEMEGWMEKARLASAEKDRERAISQQYLMNELQNKAAMYENLERIKFEELQRKDMMIYRLEGELRMMTSVIDGYRKALKEMKKSSREHRKRCPLRDGNPVYKDVKGSGGLVLSTTEIEKLRLKQEAEDRVTRAQIESQVEEFENHCVKEFQGHLEAVEMLNERVIEVENEVKILKETRSENKNLKTPEVAAVSAFTEATLSDNKNLKTPEVAGSTEETLSENKNVKTPEVPASTEETVSDTR